ncbi:tRNA uridine-5-carboxymethylaminomethyl(34) synthesis enzyme MnmG [Alistipes sp. OttesenSCG-928-L06]|nr:tRNA uridine-5-carboxymethylaminomethyl(34) synthesis enzyme MnmG [Alistipes sp. OttesenSCG-928-L06]
MRFEYDIIVVGAGHAGCEAAAAAARMGSQTLLITMDMTKFANMSCNPAVGGVAKGQIVREIDALGGRMGEITDRTTIQFRMLNRSKGAAMWSPRAQCDKQAFSLEWRRELENTENLAIWQDTVLRLIVEDSEVKGVQTALGVEFRAQAVVLTNGTFLNGLMHVGRAQTTGGRAGDPASYGLSEQLRDLGFEVARMKTGTPARIDGRSVDFARLEPQYGDEKPEKFSYNSDIVPVKEQLPCYLVYTSLNVHDTLRTGFEDSPLFNGTIRGIGPRYCPSIEDKLRTFADKDQHQLFLEPEGRDTNEYYLNGFSSSLPWQVQVEALQQIKGFENIRIYRPGYAIEYDYFPPTQLFHTLETKLIQGLYFAGQINGTTGYEEAGAQGLMAGANAHLKITGGEPFVLRRDQAYIGVLIDDLVTKGVDEPYRMFTSRAEYRILLRQDNADLRLTPSAYAIGLASEKQRRIALEKQEKIDALLHFIEKTSVSPAEINAYLNEITTPPLQQKRKLIDLVLRNGVTIEGISKHFTPLSDLLTEQNYTPEQVEGTEILIKYSGYIEREKQAADKLQRLENIRIRPNFDFNTLTSLSIESRQKLTKIRPATIGQASRIPGVSPADINVLLVYFGR